MQVKLVATRLPVKRFPYVFAFYDPCLRIKELNVNNTPNLSKKGATERKTSQIVNRRSLKSKTESLTDLWGAS